MLTSSEIKQIKSLKDKASRHEQQKFVVEGEKMIAELAHSAFNIIAVYATDEWIGQANNQILGLLKEKLIQVKTKELERISSLKQPNGVLALVAMPQQQETEIKFNDIILAFDDISDPGNLGSIIRIADWFGIKQIVCSSTSVDLYNSKTIQATMGSIFRVNIFYTDVEKWISANKQNATFYATMLNGKSVYSVAKKKPAVLVFGNESRGISHSIQQLIDQAISIPKFPDEKSSSVESLNIAMSAAVFCSEWRRD